MTDQDVILSCGCGFALNAYGTYICHRHYVGLVSSDLRLPLIDTGEAGQMTEAEALQFTSKRQLVDEAAVQQFEAFVQGQQPASTPWQPVTDYSFEARKAIEGIHPQLIKDVFQPKVVLDAGCGRGAVLVRLLREIGVTAWGWDVAMPNEFIATPEHWWSGRADITSDNDESNEYGPGFDLVICREVCEHLTVPQIRQTVRNLVRLSSKYIYLTTRFCQQPTHLLSVDSHDELDPTHITMLSKPFLRTLFVLEGCKSRYDLEERMDHKKLGRCLVFEVA